MHWPKPKFPPGIGILSWFSILFCENPPIWEVIRITVLSVSYILLQPCFHSRNNPMDWLFCLLTLLWLVFGNIKRTIFISVYLENLWFLSLQILQTRSLQTRSVCGVKIRDFDSVCGIENLWFSNASQK